MPRLSVIVPNYNHAPYLKQRIDSILNQTYQDFELILLDDCSADGSREVIETYRSNPKVTQIIINEKNGGTAFKQWDKGIKLAQGEWIWIAESDDWADPDFLETVLGEVDAHPDCGIAYTLARYMRDDIEQWKTQASGEVVAYQGSDFIQHKLLFANVIYNVSMTIFKKALFANVKPELYEQMQLCGDWFFYTMLCEQTDVLEIQQLHSYYRMHSDNTSSKAEVKGLSFLEGLDVLDYIVEHFAVKPYEYAFSWGKMFVKYEKKYSFSRETKREIKRRLRGRHLPILIDYYLIKVVYCLKGKG